MGGNDPIPYCSKCEASQAAAAASALLSCVGCLEQMQKDGQHERVRDELSRKKTT